MYKIDKAYKIVHTILNENHYGTLTPARFNTLAYNAQQSVFFEAINYIKRMRLTSLKRREYRDTVKLYNEALSPLFERGKELTSTTETILGSATTRTVFTKTDDIAYVEGAACNNTDGNIKELTIISVNSAIELVDHLMPPTESNPIAIDKGMVYEIKPNTIDNMYLYYYRHPNAPNWTYEPVLSNNQPGFNSSDPNFQDFEIGAELLDDIILHILKDAGIHLQRGDVAQYYHSIDAYNDQQEVYKGQQGSSNQQSQ